ncbi:hypothetical protein Nepgr_002354 [Nepenthes gracilis]|uniref:RING-type E3 ubiquitin transferase n=1 Tax=Nepenthes gracilis TaxID=150966 RepID=A0AAD3RYE0_NEPGR|nr:hypothetical protein Nepgr_002354 [Nepenthes gracilis]
MERTRYYDVDSSAELNSIREGEVMEEPEMTERVVEDKLFVAVASKVKESKSTVLWALQNSQGSQICIIYVHQPAKTISVLGGKFPISSLGEQEVRAHRETERREVNKILDEYICLCSKAGANAEKLYIEMDTIEKGIVELISQYRIGKLVMGGAADGRYSRKMIELKSKKAKYVRLHAPSFCHIWFICKGRLIHTREGIKGLNLNMVEDNRSKPGFYQGQELYNRSSVGMLSPSSSTASGSSAPGSLFLAGGSFSEFDQSSGTTISRSSTLSTQSEAAGSSPFSSPFESIREREARFGLSPLHRPQKKPPNALASIALERDMNEKLYQQLEQAMAEAENFRRQVFEESMRCRKAEKDMIEAIHKEKASESLYVEELKRRKEIEQELAKQTSEYEGMKQQLDMVLEQLRVALDQKSWLESRIEKSDLLGGVEVDTANGNQAPSYS